LQVEIKAMRNDDDLRVPERPDQAEADFGRLTSFNEHRALLFSVAYRMVGSVTDAEDLLQETFIRWQQAADADIRSPKAFLITIVSRLCINHLQSARVQREEYVGEWLPEPLATDPASDPSGVLRIDESISMAFLVMLERLTPVERAVLVLREVFDYEYAEAAVVHGQLMQGLPNFWVHVTGRYYFPGMYTAILPMIPGIYGIRQLLQSRNGRSR
jgi:RNA polymerase sigma-70 factor, ECF subfamily